MTFKNGKERNETRCPRRAYTRCARSSLVAAFSEQARLSPVQAATKEIAVKTSVVWQALGVVMTAAVLGCAGASPPVQSGSPQGPSLPAQPETPLPAPAPGARLARIEIEAKLPGGGVGRAVHTLRYDAAGRLLDKTIDMGSGATLVESYGYDADGRVVTVTRRSLDETGSTETRAYDGQGRLVRTCSFEQVGVFAVMPNNRCQETSYDAKGHASEEREITFSRAEIPQGQPWSATQVVSEEDAAGRVVKEHREQGGKRLSTKRFEYDAAGRVTLETFDVLATPELELKKVSSYGADGKLQRLVRTQGGNLGPGEATYEYAGGELVRARGALMGELMAPSNDAVAIYVYAR